jgi:hypothetical protein
MSARFGMGVLALGGAVAALGVVMMPTACTVLTNDALPDDAGPFEGGEAGDGGHASCASCLTQQCTGQQAACLVDATCSTIAACVAGGGTVASCLCTVGAGVDGGPSPRGNYAAYVQCQNASLCASACSSACVAECAIAPADGAAPDLTCGAGDAGDVDAGDDGGDASTPPPPVTVSGCSGCIAGNCGDPKKACAVGSECESFLDCGSACKDTACIDGCGTNFASGKEAARELSDCVVTACASACGL